MPGVLAHLIAGNAMFLIGTVIIHKFSKLPSSTQNILLLYGVCIFSSIIPDFFLALYFVFHVGTYESLIVFHDQLHHFVSPIATIFFVVLAGLDIIKKKPIWVMGPVCIILHVIMDSIIREGSVYF
jgi:hypothetical protein